MNDINQPTRFLEILTGHCRLPGDETEKNESEEGCNKIGNRPCPGWKAEDEKVNVNMCLCNLGGTQGKEDHQP